MIIVLYIGWLMKALLCTTYGPASGLELQDIPEPQITDDQVLIDVSHCGLNFPDTLTIKGEDQYGPPMPFSPGGEYSGVISEVGANVDHVKVGDRVLVGTIWGGLREKAAAPGYNLHKLPDGMSFEIASIFLVTYGTAYHCLVDRAQLKFGETVAVLGAAGGIGLATIQVAKALGARVIACASTDEKLDVCRKSGADEVINYSNEDLKLRLKELTGGKGVDVVCDPVGSDYSEAALRATAWNGRFMVLGFTAGQIARIPLNLPLLKGNSISGVFWSTFVRKEPELNRKNINSLFALWIEGKIAPVVYKTYSFKDAKIAFDDIQERRVMGKVSIKVG